MADETKQVLDELGTNVKSLLPKIDEHESAITEVKDKIKAVENLPTDVTEIKNTVKVLKDNADKNQEALDKLLAEQQKQNIFGNQINKESFKYGLEKELKAREAKLKTYKNTREGFQFEVKAVGDIAAGNFTTSGTQTFAGPTMIPGVQRIAYNQNRLRDIIGTTQVQTDSVAVIRGVAGEGAPTVVGVGALKPQSDADWVKVIVPITKIAHYYTIPEEYLEDVSWLADDITQTGVSELMKIENNLLISQTAGAGVFGGLIQNSTAFAAPSGLALAVDFANNYDVLVAAITQLRNGFRDANFILVDNDSYAKMVLAKSASDGHYLFGAPNISIPNVGGVPIYPMAVTTLADKFIVGDRNYATVAVRAGISVRFYDQHANNAIYNLVTVVVEERLALVVKRTDAFIYGDFSDAAAALETA
jgi:HK97 family phage major capsid protein